MSAGTATPGWHAWGAALGCLLLGACSTLPPAPVSAPSGAAPASRGASSAPPASRGASSAPSASRGAYYKDDGPGDNPPADLAGIADAQPRPEPLHRFANRPYEALGKSYVPLADAANFRQRGRATWYGRRFHGQPTSSGEPYDMYAMTGAHPTLPIPSYARVTNLANGRSVVVRINDRGPFHPDRVLDLSYTAAAKLGYAEAGSADVEIAAVVPGDTRTAALPAPAAPSPSREPGTAAAMAAIPAGIYLQLGAFSAHDNAESFRVRLYRELAWLAQALHIVPAGSAFRLHLGPFRSRNEAQPVAERIRSELNFTPLFVTR